MFSQFHRSTYIGLAVLLFVLPICAALGLDRAAAALAKRPAFFDAPSQAAEFIATTGRSR